jgi:hypothetical protein
MLNLIAQLLIKKLRFRLYSKLMFLRCIPVIFGSITLIFIYLNIYSAVIDMCVSIFAAK